MRERESFPHCCLLSPPTSCADDPFSSFLPPPAPEQQQQPPEAATNEGTTAQLQQPASHAPPGRSGSGCHAASGSSPSVTAGAVTDPGTDTFVLIYTGDHSHPVPIHRNSLAGTSRNKQHRPPNPLLLGRSKLRFPQPHRRRRRR